MDDSRLKDKTRSVHEQSHNMEGEGFVIRASASPVDGVHTEEAGAHFAQTAAQDGAPADGTRKDGAPADGTRKDGARKDAAQADAAQADGASDGAAGAPAKERAGRQRVRLRPETRAQMLDRLTNPTISLHEASVILDVCPATVRRYTNLGVLSHERTAGGQRRFRLRTVMNLLRELESKRRSDK